MQIGSDDENSLGGLYSNSLVDPSIPVTSYGRAGNIDITATDTLLMTDRSDIRAGTNTEGNGGNINIDTAHFRLEGGNVGVNSSGAGIAGDILITAGKLTIDGTPVNVSGSPETPGIYAASVSSGGSISVNAGQILLVNGAQISASVTGDESSAGGNVTLTSDTLVVLDESRIKANATQGRGGRIVVDTEAFIRDAGGDDVLDASSGSDVRERQGTVSLQVDVDIGREIGSHETQTLSGSVNGSPCAQDRRTSSATLAKAGIGGLPADNRPEGLTGSFAVKSSGTIEMVGNASVDAVIRRGVLVSGRQADSSSTRSDGCLL
jgi:large exoprotein involved in heme utilization and adhesion